MVTGDLAADVGRGTPADLVEGSGGVVDLGEVKVTAEMVGLTGTSICMVKMMLLSLDDEILARLDGECFTSGVVTGGGFTLRGGGQRLERESDETGISVTELSR